MLARRHTHFIDDLHRPVYHFLPPQNWMNDPNGLIHWKGKYHLFYQHNPFDAVWGTMHWGHAISHDLVHWQDMPHALAPTPDSPDEAGVWSGCVVNHNGVATAVYTGVRGDNHELQTVCLAVSYDADLRTWQKFAHNPVICAPPEEFSGCGFRDPYVWREADAWYMVIGAGIKDGGEAVLLYRSQNLYEWEYLSPLVVSDAQNDYVYECPNFFQIGDKWVLLVSVMPEACVEYYVGILWHNHFLIESHGVLVDAPFYAPLTFKDHLGRRLMMGWLRETRPHEPGYVTGWSGVMSLPIQIDLLESNQILLTPIRESLQEKDTTGYWFFQNVGEDQLHELQAEVGSTALKIVISEDMSQTLFVDHSIAEYFSFPHYQTKRLYGEDEAGLKALKHFVSFPIERIGVWSIASIWGK